MKHCLTLAGLLVALASSAVTAQAAPMVHHAAKAAHVKMVAAKAAPRSAPKAQASSCCAGGNCCANGDCCAMAGCCQSGGACCSPEQGICLDSCGCLTMACCGK